MAVMTGGGGGFRLQRSPRKTRKHTSPACALFWPSQASATSPVITARPKAPKTLDSHENINMRRDGLFSSENIMVLGLHIDENIKLFSFVIYLH